MPVQQLLVYARQAATATLVPYEAILRAAAAAGDAAVPAPAQIAVLRWVERAFATLEQSVALEEPLAAAVRRFLPLATIAALAEPQFLQPDQHPLHRLLDMLLSRAAGWQPRLGRAGLALPQQLAEAAERVLAALTENTLDIDTVCSEVVAAVTRDERRAQLMAQRVVETEQGKLRTIQARGEAARMINAALAQHSVPRELGKMLTGAWFASAQLVLLRFGADSPQWQRMSATTSQLLESVQSLEDADDRKRQQVFELVARMPRDVRRWLWSLHHDTAAVNETMELLQEVHMRVLRRQPFATINVPPIAIEDTPSELSGPQFEKLLKAVAEGQWFIIRQSPGDTLRARLTRKDGERQHMLFTNLVGVRALELSYGRFVEMARAKQIAPLPHLALFSRSLCAAAGIHSLEELQAAAADVATS